MACRVQHDLDVDEHSAKAGLGDEGPWASWADDDAVVQARDRQGSVTCPNAVDLPCSPTLADFEALERGELDTLVIADRYRVDRWLECGGMASIFVGEELATGREVAIKVLQRGGENWHSTLLRFITEARTSYSIRHPNIVEVLDWGTTPDAVMYIVMELLRGEDLHATLERRGRLPWERVKPLMLQLCAGLEAVHDAGVVHCDVKPANCFRAVDGGLETLKLVDFGIATLTPAALAGQPPVGSEVVGTPEYMSPEQIRGESLDPRTDVYSAGVILAELLTGRTPFEGSDRTAIFEGHLRGQVPPLRRLAPPHLHFDRRLESIFARALAKRRGDRFASIREFAAALEGVPAHCEALVSGEFLELPVLLAQARLEASRTLRDERELAALGALDDLDDLDGVDRPEARDDECTDELPFIEASGSFEARAQGKQGLLDKLLDRIRHRWRR